MIDRPAVPDDYPDGPLEPAQRIRAKRGFGSRWDWLFLLVLVAAGFMIFRLWEEGTRAALRTTSGRIVEITNDPASPGFQAYLDPTPTLLVAHTDGGELVGVTVMTQAVSGAGGHLVLIAPDLALDPVAHPSLNERISLGEAFGENGVEILQVLVAELFGFGFLEAVEIDTERLGVMMDKVGLIPFDLARDLGHEAKPGEFVVWKPKGRHRFDGSTAAGVYGFRNPGELDTDRLNRQLGLWHSWLGEIGGLVEPSDAVPEGAFGLAPYLRSLGTGRAEMAILAGDPVEIGDGLTMFTLGDRHRAWLRESAAVMVPVPIPIPGEQRPSVRLLDGVGDRGNLNQAMDELFDSGMQVTMIGNTTRFGVEASSVTYHAAPDEAAARALADELGIVLLFNENADPLSRFTVVIGTDWRGR